MKGETTVIYGGNVQHGGFVLFWGCFATTGKGCVESMPAGNNEILRLSRYSRKKNVLPSVRKLALSCRSWVLQQDNDSKHTANITQEWLSNRIMTQNTLLTSPKNGEVQNKQFWSGFLWALIPLKICGRSWNLSFGESNIQTWDNWKSLVVKTGQNTCWEVQKSHWKLQKLFDCNDCLKKLCKKILSLGYRHLCGCYEFPP